MEIDSSKILGVLLASSLLGNGISVDSIVGSSQEAAEAQQTEEALTRYGTLLVEQVEFCWDKIPELRERLRTCEESPE